MHQCCTRAIRPAPLIVLSTVILDAAGLWCFQNHASRLLSCAIVVASVFVTKIHLPNRSSCEVASALLIWASLRSSVCTMLTACAVLMAFVCPCLPPNNCSMDHFDDSQLCAPMDFDGLGFDEPPSEAELAQSGAATTSAMPPSTPCIQVVEQEPAPKRRRIGRKTSEA